MKFSLKSRRGVGVVLRGGGWGADGLRKGADEACLRVRGGPMLRGSVDVLDR